MSIDLTQHWTRPCKLPGARFGIGLLLQFFLINQVQFIRQSINISFKNITSKRHLLITLWKTLNQHWVLIAGSTKCCQLLFSLTAHFPIQDVFGGAQTHFGAARPSTGPKMCITGTKVCLGIIHLF
jgi:hypothetical protein